ncbi:MAG: pseudouridine synthase [Micrococcaceae bacterium]
MYQPPLLNGLRPSKVMVGNTDKETVGSYLVAKFGPQPKPLKLLDEHGNDLSLDSALPKLIYVYRQPFAEEPIPFNFEILYEDEHLLIIDKPHFLATIPSGKHLRETVVTRLRLQGYEDIAPLHRLDRLTAGVVALSKLPKDRRVYSMLFQNKQVTKTYEALAPVSNLKLPYTIENKLVKTKASLQAQIVLGIANSKTVIISEIPQNNKLSLYTLKPETGKFHQLRAHMNYLGLPILNDTYYPDIQPLPKKEDFTKPLKLLAKTLAFTDPITGIHHTFTSKKKLTIA